MDLYGAVDALSFAVCHFLGFFFPMLRRALSLKLRASVLPRKVEKKDSCWDLQD